jgi:sterol desaturase/sphingolipid hydroxylase (fatty acid hydroxylase superfamily)
MRYTLAVENVWAYLEYASYVIFAITALAYVHALLFVRKSAPKETLGNLGIWGVNELLKLVITGGSMMVVLRPLTKHVPYHLPATPLVFLLTLLTADFIYYWKHRAAHEVRFLWVFHSVHHSSNEYNLSTAIRLPWFGAFLDAFFYVPAVLVGFDPVLLLLGKILVLLYQYWIHTEVIGSMGWFDRCFNSPSNHRVHHGSNRKYLDMNHGGVLIIWDKLFGTYQKEEERPVYGLTKPLVSNNPLAINLHEPKKLALDLFRSRTLGEGLGYLFKGPGWRPGARRERALGVIAI